MKRDYTNVNEILDLSANGSSVMEKVKDFRHITVEVVTTGLTGTLKFYGSIQHDLPDLTVSATLTNAWTAIELKDLEDEASVVGDTGLAKTTDTTIRLYEVNTNMVAYFGVTLSGHSAGSVRVRILPVSN